MSNLAHLHPNFFIADVIIAGKYIKRMPPSKALNAKLWYDMINI